MTTLMKDLKEMLRGMDIPEQRIEREDWAWCLRNLAVRNAGHPDFEQVKSLLIAAGRLS